jgi:hypothetical protein
MNQASSSKHPRGPHHTLSAVHAVPCAPCATNKSSMRKRNEQKQILRASRIGSRTGESTPGGFLVESVSTSGRATLAPVGGAPIQGSTLRAKLDVASGSASTMI